MKWKVRNQARSEDRGRWKKQSCSRTEMSDEFRAKVEKKKKRNKKQKEMMKKNKSKNSRATVHFMYPHTFPFFIHRASATTSQHFAVVSSFLFVFVTNTAAGYTRKLAKGLEKKKSRSGISQHCRFGPRAIHSQTSRLRQKME